MHPGAVSIKLSRIVSVGAVALLAVTLAARSIAGTLTGGARSAAAVHRAAANSLAGHGPPAVRPRARTIVSLEFDHAFTDQLPAIALANSLGMKVTVFAMSGRLGLPGYMTASQLLGVQAAGNEIGGHTIDHPDLAQLSAGAQRHEICDDRTALAADGLTVTDFAYPYGDFGPLTPEIVRACGYESARAAGGLRAPSGCGGPCRGPAAETIPPAHPFDTLSANSVLSSTSLSAIEGYVIAARKAGGGWVQIVFHYVCAACDPYSVSPQTLAAFFEWLSRQRSAETTEETVHEVLTTPFRPGILAVSSGHRTLRLRPVKICPATPVGATCSVAARGRVPSLPVTAGSRLLLRTATLARSIRLDMDHEHAWARRRAGEPSARSLVWWLTVPAQLARGRATISMREPLGVATYALRVDPQVGR